MNGTFQKYLRSIGACDEARVWAANRTAYQAWSDCDRADWLLWWAARVGVDRRTLVKLACEFARTALQFVKAGEERPLKAIEAAEAWCRSNATIEQVRVARADAADAYAAYAAAAYAAAAAAARYSEKWNQTRAAKLREFASVVRELIGFKDDQPCDRAEVPQC